MLIGDETSSQCGAKMRDAKAGVNVRLIEIIVPVVVGSMICAALGVVLFPRYLSSPLLSSPFFSFFTFFSFFFALLLRLAILFSPSLYTHMAMQGEDVVATEPCEECTRDGSG